MARVLVTYHSFTGMTKELAEAAAEGARNGGADVIIKEVAATTVQDVVEADGLLVATPQTFGAMAGETKKLFERLWVERQGIAPKKPFSVIICHKSGPEPTLDLMDKLATYFDFTKVGESLTVPAAGIEESKPACREIGSTLAKAL